MAAINTGSPTFITPMFAQLPAGAAAVSFGTSDTESLAVVLCGILQSPPAPVQADPDRPAVKVEAAFGYQPGDRTSVPVWTDISNRARQPDGVTTFQSGRGKSYELSTPEAGSITIELDNADGALNPLNSASPFYPNVTDSLLLRVSAFWDGIWYTIGKGWASNLPQEWPDPQYGFSSVTAYDGVGALANFNMYSAYASEVLLDNPSSYWQLSEGYSAANGQPFGNLAVGNPVPMVGLDGGSDKTGAIVPLACGQALNMLGDTGSGAGISGLSAPQHAWSAGLIGVDPDFPNLTSGVTVEFWTSIAASTYEYVQPLVTLLGRPCNYSFEGGAGRVQLVIQYVPPQAGVKNSGTSADLFLTIQDFRGNKSTFTGLNVLPMDGNAHHHVFTLNNSTNFAVNYYLDGDQVNSMSGTTSGVGTNNDVYAMILGPATDVMLPSNFAFLFPLASDYTLGHVAVYPRVLPTWRISTHYDVGAGSGAAGEDNIARFSRIMAYSGTGLPRAGDAGSAAPTLAAADSFAGQDTMSNLADLTVTEGGFVYSAGNGTVHYQSRTGLYNQPVEWVFGDNPVNGEIPYDPGQSFDFDVTYLYNWVQVQRQAGKRQVDTVTTQGVSTVTYTDIGAQVTAVDTDSVVQFMPRNSLQQTVLSATDQDAYDRVNWSLTKYKQPVYRLPSITLTPLVTKGVWPVALGVEQGDVVQVIRRPVGAPAYTVTGVVQQVGQEAGSDHWNTTVSISPLNIEQNILQIGAGTGFNTLGGNRVGW